MWFSYVYKVQQPFVCLFNLLPGYKDIGIRKVLIAGNKQFLLISMKIKSNFFCNFFVAGTTSTLHVFSRTLQSGLPSVESTQYDLCN